MENEKYINKEELRIMLHISKRKATWMLENGVIPCINSGKKTRQFKIKLSDHQYLGKRRKHTHGYRF